MHLQTIPKRRNKVSYLWTKTTQPEKNSIKTPYLENCTHEPIVNRSEREVEINGFEKDGEPIPAEKVAVAKANKRAIRLKPHSLKVDVTVFEKNMSLEVM